MTSSPTRRARLKFNRPALRKNARPPKRRSSLGQTFSNANLGGVMVMQHCADCGTVQYPSRELCGRCLGDRLRWREADNSGRILSRAELHHSLWEYYKRRTGAAPWSIASVKLDCGPIVFAHLAATGAKSGQGVKVFTHCDCSLNSVIIAVARDTDLDTAEQRKAIAESLGLTEVARRNGGI